MSLKSILLKARSSLLFLPAIYGFISLILAILSLNFDIYLSENNGLHHKIPAIFLVNLDLAQTVLSTISSSLLTMTTITFSSIMIVLTTYLSQFSPRTLQNFIADQSTQRVLGIFVGGFVYSIILLLLLREKDPHSLFFTPTLAVVFAIICLIVFVFFINHVSSWIQVSNLIHNITANTIATIHKKNSFKNDDPWENWEALELGHLPSIKVKAVHSGYLKLIDIDGIVKKASEDDCIVKIEMRPGDYIDQDTNVLTIWNLTDTGKCIHYLSFISVGLEKAPLEDIEFGLRKLVEIALRAISPAVNDPNTARSCIHQLGKILAKLGQTNLPKSYHNDGEHNLRLIAEKPSFQEFLYKSFYQIKHYGSNDISVLVTMIEALQYIAESTDKTRKEIVWQFSMYIMEGIEKDKLPSLDAQYLDMHLNILKKTAGHFNHK